MLLELDSRQIGEWMAFGMLEPVGAPVPPDPEAVAENNRKAKRAEVEGGLRALKQKRGG